MTQERIRVLRVITRLNVGGPTRHVRILQEGLDPGAFEQLLAHGPCPPDEGSGVLPVPGEAVPVRELGRRIHPLRDRRALARLLAVVRAFRPHVVHTHQGKAGLLGRLAAARAGVPAIVHTYHGHTFEGYFGPLVGRAVRWAERRAARRSHALVCQSPSQERDVLRALGSSARGRTRIVAPALDPAAIAGAAAGGPAARRRRILLPSRLVAVKRPLLAVDLLAALPPELADVELLVAGGGPLESGLRSRARELGVADRVRVEAPTAAMGPLYAGSSLVLLTSAAEGTPLALIEALALGVPVAATAVGGVPDLVGEAGELLDPEGPPAAWARGVARILEDEALRATRRAAGVRLVQERYRPERLVEDVARLYRELLGGAGGASVA